MRFIPDGNCGNLVLARHLALTVKCAGRWARALTYRPPQHDSVCFPKATAGTYGSRYARMVRRRPYRGCSQGRQRAT